MGSKLASKKMVVYKNIIKSVAAIKLATKKWNALNLGCVIGIHTFWKPINRQGSFIRKKGKIGESADIFNFRTNLQFEESIISRVLSILAS